jgi:hypothetical protein
VAKNSRPSESEVLTEEVIRFGFLIAALIVVYKWQWFEHQIWRIQESLNRRKNEITLAEIQVGREISLMEHGEA